MAVIYTSPLFHADDDSGAPLVGGKVYTYLNGTTTPATTYQDAAGATPNTNPITLNARGEAQVFLTSGTSYTFLVKDSLGAEKYTVNDVTGPLGASALADYAPLASPAFTGNPTAPTPLPGNNSTKIATTAFVGDAVDTAISGTNKISSNCNLSIVGALLKLSRMNGKYLSIEGVLREIPAAGVSLGVTTETADTTYYIYASWSVSGMAIMSSATSYTPSASTGMMVMNGDETKTLVGMVRTNASPAWSICRSWFNDRGFCLISSATSSIVFGGISGTYSEVSSLLRVNFLSWDGEVIDIRCMGTVEMNNSPAQMQVTLTIDGSVQDVMQAMDASAVNANSVIGLVFSESSISEGYHVASLACRSTTGTYTPTFQGSATPGERCTLSVSSSGI